MIPQHSAEYRSERRRRWNGTPVIKFIASSPSARRRRRSWLLLPAVAFLCAAVADPLPPSTTYTPCFDVLKGADSDANGSLNQPEFVEAIRVLSGGGISVEQFGELAPEIQQVFVDPLAITNAESAAGTCAGLYAGIIAGAGLELSSTNCLLAISLADIRRDDRLEEDLEFTRFADRLSGELYGTTTPFANLPGPVQAVFELFREPNVGSIDVYGGKAQHRNATEEQTAFVQNLCQQTLVASIVAQFSAETPASPAAAPVIAPVPATAPVAAPAPVTAPIAAPAPVTAPAPTSGGQFTFDLATCQSNLQISDITRDDKLNKREYFLFLSRVGDGAFDEYENFAGLPLPLQESYDSLIASSGDGTMISVDGDDSSIQRICDETRTAMNAASGDGGGTDSPPSTSPGEVADLFTFEDCLSAISLSDITRDGFLSDREYFIFLTRLPQEDIDIRALYGTYDGLAQELKDAFTSLTSTNGNTAGDMISVEGNTDAGRTEEQQSNLQVVCDTTESAIAAAAGGDDTPTASPGGTDVDIDIDTCKQDMIISDLSRDSGLDESEYVRFLNRNTEDVALTDPFDDLPKALRDNFSTLATENGGVVSINIDGARRGTAVSAEQEAFLEQVCKSTALAILAMNDAPSAPSPPSPDGQPTATGPTTSPAGPGVETIYNAIVLANSAGLGAASLRSGKNRRALDSAYDQFVEKIVEELAALDESNPGQATRNLRSHRRVQVTGLVEDSIDFFEINDTSCPSSVTEPDTVCITVYAAFDVLFDKEARQDAWIKYTQAAVTKNDFLQGLLESVDNTVTISVIETADIKKRDAPTEPPVMTPSEPSSSPVDGDGGGSPMKIIIIVCVCGFVLLAGGYGVYRFVSEGGEFSTISSRLARLKGKNLPGKSTENGSDDDAEAERAPGTKAKNDFGFEEESDNSDNDGLFAKPDTVAQDSDEESEEDPVTGTFAAEKSKDRERSRMRGALDKTTGNVLNAFGGLGGTFVQGVQKGVLTVGGEVVKGVQTVGQTAIKGTKTVGDVGLGVVGKATGGLVGKKRTGATDDNKDFDFHVDDKEFAENVEDVANYGFDDPDELKKSDDMFGWANGDGDAWGKPDALGFQEMSGQDADPSDDNDYSESESSTYDEGDNLARTDGPSRTATVHPENMRHLDAMVDRGDWDGVMEAARGFEAFDDLSVPTHTETSRNGEITEDGSQYSAYDNEDESSQVDDDDTADSRSQPNLTPQEMKRREKYRKQVEELVKECVPDEIDNIDNMLDQFAGREAELINTLQTMSARSATQRARKAVHKSKGIPEREARNFTAGGTDGSAAIAAASTLGANMGDEYDDDDDDDDYSGSYSDEGSYSDDEGSYSDEEGSYSDEGSHDEDYDEDEQSGSFDQSRSDDDDEPSEEASYFKSEEGSAVVDDQDYGYEDADAIQRTAADLFEQNEYNDEDYSASYSDDVVSYEDEQGGSKSRNEEDEGSYDDADQDGTRSYDDEEGSRSYEEGDGSQYDEEDDSRSYDGEDGEGSRSYEEKEGSQFDEEDGSRSYDDEEGSRSHEEGEGSHYDDEEGSRSHEEGEGSHYENKEGSRSHEEGEGSQYDDEEGSRSYEEGEGSQSYEEDEGSQFDEEDGSRSYDDDEEASRSYEEGEGSQYDDDEEEGSRSYEEGEGSQYDEDEGSRTRSYDDGSRSYDDEAEGSYDNDEDGSRSYDDEEGSGSKGAGNVSKNCHDDDEGSGSYSRDSQRSGSYDDEQGSQSYNSQVDGSYDDEFDD